MIRQKPVGRIYKLNNDYPNVKFEVSTVNTKPLKSLQIETRFWFDKSASENVKRDLRNIFLDCRRILHTDFSFFDTEKIIAVEDTPDDLTLKTNKVFIQYEFTIFPTEKFNSPFEISMAMTNVTNQLHSKVFSKRGEITKTKAG